MGTTPGYDVLGTDQPRVDADPTEVEPSASDTELALPRRDVSLAHGTMVGRYMVLRLLGRGGMGAVYAAHDPKLDRQVALKLLHSPRGDAPERLVREAQALARLSDPHVVSVYDAGEIDDRVFIAMQLVDGEDLASALAKRKPGLAQILEWFVDAGRGLAAAHAAGLVHRDFKPSNVLIDRRGHVAVTDFGLVRTITADENRGLTGMGDILGTPAFMSPEQHNLQPATEASDQFSFCVSLWDALFDRHPFVEGDRGSMSPFEIGHKIFDGTLIPPPKKNRVPRRVIDALTRGLQREPAKRWPSMNALLAELVPAAPRRATAIVAGGIAAAAIGGAAVFFAMGRGEDAEAVCRADVQRRAASAWSPAASAQVTERFKHSQRSYAEAAARGATSEIDRYTVRWSELSNDVCTAERAARGARSDLVARRRSCLDARLDALRGLAHLFATEDRPEFVDHAREMAEGLPDLADCADPVALLAAPGAPPPATAAELGKLDLELGLAISRAHGADPGARAELARIAARADELAWTPLQARAHLALGEHDVTAMFEPSTAELTRAGELATTARLDREAARAWSLAIVSAALERNTEAVAVLEPVARAAAARTADRGLIVDAEIARGRAMVRLGRLQEGADACRAAHTAAKGLQRNVSIGSARDCLLESLLPLAAVAEAEPILEAAIDEQSKALGDDHPRVADYLTMRSALAVRRGKIAEARADAERVLAIRKRVFPARHFKIAEALQNIAQVTMAEGKFAEAKQLYEDARSIAAEAKPEQLMLLASIHTMLAVIAQQVEHDQASAMRHFETAIPLVRKKLGAESLELGVLLSNYGQIKANDDLDAGLAILDEARAILDRRRDKRANLVTVAMADVEVQHKRWTAARTHAEDMLAHVAADEDPGNVAIAKWLLAQALVETGGDAARARKLATEARPVFEQLGAAQAADLKKIDAWLARHK